MTALLAIGTASLVATLGPKCELVVPASSRGVDRRLSTATV